METSISEEDGGSYAKFFLLVVVVLLGISYVRHVDDTRKYESKAMTEHERIVSTTDGTELVRVRHIPVRTPDGNCSLTVQRYERRSEEKDLFREPPHTTTLECDKSAM
jgi:hypothetical protein